MFGWIVAGHQLGAATAALGAGALRTWLGSYFQTFILSGVLCLIAALLVLRIGQSPSQKRFEELQQFPNT